MILTDLCWSVLSCLARDVDLLFAKLSVGSHKFAILRSPRTFGFKYPAFFKCQVDKRIGIPVLLLRAFGCRAAVGQETASSRLSSPIEVSAEGQSWCPKEDATDQTKAMSHLKQIGFLAETTMLTSWRMTPLWVKRGFRAKTNGDSSIIPLSVVSSESFQHSQARFHLKFANVSPVGYPLPPWKCVLAWHIQTLRLLARLDDWVPRRQVMSVDIQIYIDLQLHWDREPLNHLSSQWH